MEPGHCVADFICNVSEHLPETFLGCWGDVDGNGVVNAADRGFISANIGNTGPVAICLYDLDGNGFINAGDRGFASANIDLCAPLPDWMDGSGCNHGACPDLRYAGEFQGVDSSCSESPCG